MQKMFSLDVSEVIHIFVVRLYNVIKKIRRLKRNHECFKAYFEFIKRKYHIIEAFYLHFFS